MLEYLSTNLWQLWLIIAVVCLIVEMTSFDFYVTCFAIGALGAMCGALVALPAWLQIIIWALVSLLSIWLVRPSLTKRLHKGGAERKSNADALIGREGVVIDEITPQKPGYVKIDGDEWRSVSLDGSIINKGTRVRVVKRESIILTVAAPSPSLPEGRE